MLSIIFSIQAINNNNNTIIVLQFQIAAALNLRKMLKYQSNNNSSKEENLINTYNTSSFINENYIFQMVSPVKIGFLHKVIIAFINIQYDNLLLGELSEIQNINKYDYFELKNKYNKLNNTIIEDNLYLFKNYSENKYSIIPNLKFLLNNINENNITSLIIGLTISDDANKTNFMKQIHDNHIISSYIISFDYSNENEGILIIGKFPHEYNSERFSESDYKSFYSYQPRTMYLTNFVINFDEIFSFSNNEKYFFQKITKGNLILNSGLIIGTNEYMQFILNHFFNEHIKNNLCVLSSYDSDLKNYFIFYCYDNQNLTLDKFPTLNFRIKSENITFQFTHKDLFIKIENKYYFLIIFEKFITGFWRFGKPFFLKYTFVYNGDTKTIGFYLKKNINVMDGKNNNNKSEEKKMEI